MDQRPATPPPWLPARRPSPLVPRPGPPPHDPPPGPPPTDPVAPLDGCPRSQGPGRRSPGWPGPGSHAPGSHAPGSPGPGSPGPNSPGPNSPGPASRGRFGWLPLARTRRGAAGLAIAGSALLLWPFAELSWIPWLVGFGVLVLLRLARLDVLLRGWDVHLAGLAVVAGLMITTTPWAWAVAASIGVLLGGLVQLPRWPLAAVGAALCLLTGSGFVWANVRDAREAVAAQAAIQTRSRQDQGAPRPDSVLPILLNRIARASPDAVCDNLLSEPARAPFAAAAGQPDCDAAVRTLAAHVTDRARYADPDVPSEVAGDGLTVDACRMSWGPTAAGPQLGHLTITAVAPARYAVTTFRPC